MVGRHRGQGRKGHPSIKERAPDGSRGSSSTAPQGPSPVRAPDGSRGSSSTALQGPSPVQKPREADVLQDFFEVH